MTHNQVSLDVFWLRIVRQRQHRLEKRADRGPLPFFGDGSQQVEVLMAHVRTLTRREPRASAATAQPL
jgi:predicted nucleotidyltransferase